MRKKIFFLFYILMSAGIFFSVVKSCLAKDSFAAFVQNMESTIEEGIPGRSKLREIYGFSNKIISPNEIATDGGATVKDENGFLESINYVSYDISEAESKIYELNEVCKSSNTDFVYVSYPSKTNTQTTAEYYGIETNREETRNNFLNRLKDNGINILNVRTLLEEEGYQVKDIFYKTDHHWKSTAGLFGARAIINYLNDSFDYELRDDMLDESQFEFTTYPDLWLGEEGRKVSRSWVGTLDDFTEIKPVYETSLRVGAYGSEEKNEGDFSLLIDESGYNGEVNLYSYSAHYSYLGSGSLTEIHNNNVDGKKILIIKDSFSVVVIPFLSLATSDVVVWDMRTTSEGLYDFIEQNDFDVVLLAYTDFWRADMYKFN